MPDSKSLHPRPSRTDWRQQPTAGPDGLFSRSDALAAGWTDDAIAHAVTIGRWRRLSPGVYAPAAAAANVLSSPAAARGAELLLARSAQRTCPRAVISHGSAALMWDLPTLGNGSRPCVTVAAGTALRGLAAVHLHRAGLPAAEVVTVGGARITSAARTVCDVARECGSDAGVVAADAALRARLVTPAQLGAQVSRCARWPGIASARRAVALADPLSESPLESLSRLRIAAAGLPTPELQVEIGDDLGTFVGRLDFYWPEYGVAGEADGNLKYTDRSVLVDERRRQRRLESLGLVVVRWEWADLRRFAGVTRELKAAFQRGVRPGGRRWSVLPCTRIPA